MGKRKKQVPYREDSDDENIEVMKKISDQLGGKITELNRMLLTVADVSISKIRNEAILTWRKKNPELISDNTFQRADECWAIAFSRGLYAISKQHDKILSPTADSLVQIAKKFLTERNGLPNARALPPSWLRKYNCKLVVHRRPKLGLEKENVDFEKFIERLLAVAPVAMCFHYVPSYPDFQHHKYDVFRPKSTDYEAMRYESLDGHCALISGRGVVLRGGESFEFWEIHETRGAKLGDNGFSRMERYKKLVSEVYEFQLLDLEEATTSTGS